MICLLMFMQLKCCLGFAIKIFSIFFSNPKCCLEGHKHTLLTDISILFTTFSVPPSFFS